MFRMHHPHNQPPSVIELDNIWSYVSSIRADQPPQPMSSPRRIKVEQRASLDGGWVEVGEVLHYASGDVQYQPLPIPAA